MENILKLISKLSEINHDLYGEDFLLTWNKTEESIRAVLLVVEILEKMIKNNISPKLFDTGLGFSNFRDQSTRTRYSFAAGINMLGLGLYDHDESKSQQAHGETVRETANMVSFFTEVIGIRDDKYIGFGHTYQVEVSEAVNEGALNGVLLTRPPIINLQCDLDHPTQSLSDLTHLINYFGGIENLKGKKLAMSWAFSPSYGKPLSVPQGIIGLLSRFGMNIVLAHPEGYELLPEVVEKATEFSEKSGGTFKITNSMKEAFENADVVYPKSWAPMFIMEKRAEKYSGEGINEFVYKELEKECIESNSKHIDWECTQEMMDLTNNALYMHCLPADITGVSCEKGEVSKEVFEKFRLETYKEAHHKMYVIASMIALSKFKNLPSLLENKVKELENFKRIK